MNEIKNMREKAEESLYRNAYRDAFDQVKLGIDAREKVLGIAAEGEEKGAYTAEEGFPWLWQSVWRLCLLQARHWQ